MDRSLESRLIDEIIKERDLLRLSRDQINQEVLSLRNKVHIFFKIVTVQCSRIGCSVSLF